MAQKLVEMLDRPGINTQNIISVARRGVAFEDSMVGKHGVFERLMTAKTDHYLDETLDR